MRHTFWKKCLSYFKEISLEETHSVYNPFLAVLLVEGRHQLVTEDAIYSFDDKYLNFDFAFSKINWNKLKKNKALVLGLGLGSVILLLEKKYGVTFDYTAVEIDPEICRLCNKYTLDEIESHVEIVPVEAMRFLNPRNNRYDLIIMDIFQGGEIPRKFQSTEFLKLLRDHLEPSGILLYNRMNITANHKEENERFLPVMGSVFPNRKELIVKDNIICVNDKDHLI